MRNRFVLVPVAAFTIFATGCNAFRTDEDYHQMDLHLGALSARTMEALMAAIQDRPSKSSAALLHALFKAEEAHQAELKNADIDQSHGHNKRIYLINLRHFNESNQLMRQFGYGQVTQEFKP